MSYQDRFSELDLPVLHLSGMSVPLVSHQGLRRCCGAIAGWHDVDQMGALLNFAGMTNRGGGTSRTKQKLVRRSV